MLQSDSSGAAGKASSSGKWRPIALLLAVIGVIVLARWLDLGDRVDDLRQWLEGLGPLGPLVFVLLYVAAVVLALPGSAITILAGALFGSTLGVVLVSVGSTVGAALAFLIGRYFAREAASRWLEGNERFRRLDAMTERHGALIVAITRLVPIFPFNLLNYGFGLTRVRFGTYVFWSWLCMLPASALYVVGGDAVTRAIAEGTVPWQLVVGLLVLSVIVGLLVRYARGRLGSAGTGSTGVGGASVAAETPVAPTALGRTPEE